jgi:DNA-binding Lrp family transcriptional regulator
MLIKGLDETDQKIIDLLLENARQSYVDIADKVDLSRVAVKARIQSLEKRGVIEKYVTVINPAKLGNTISVFFDIEIEPVSLSSVVEILLENPAFTQVYQMTGHSRLHIHAIISNDDELDRLLNDVIYKLPGLKNLNCDTILTRIKDQKGVRL